MKYIPSSSYGSPGAPSAIPQMVQRRRTFHVFGFLATSLLFLSLISAAGIFFYQKEMEKQLTKAKEELGTRSTSDNEKKIAEIETFYHKLRTANMLLENHRAPSKLFTELERITKKTVQLTSLTYTYDPGFDIELELAADTDELASVLLQKRKLLSESLFSVVSVSGIASSLDTPGTEDDTQQDIGEKKISFSIKGLLKDDVVAYDGKSATGRANSTSVVSTSGSTTVPVDDVTGTTTDNEIIE